MKLDKNKKFVGRMFDEISPSYDRMNHIMSGFQDLRWRKKAAKYLSSLSGTYDNILDLAAGSGDFGKELIKLNPQKMFSVDLSIEMLKINKNKIMDTGNIQVKADAECLPFRDDYFNLCTIGFGIRNFENLDLCLKEIYRVLKPNGVLIIIEMFRQQSESIFDRSFKLYFEKIIPKVGNTFSGSDYAYNYLFQSVNNFLHVDDFISLASETGFILQKKQKNFSNVVFSVFLQKKKC